MLSVAPEKQAKAFIKCGFNAFIEFYFTVHFQQSLSKVFNVRKLFTLNFYHYENQ